jgi:hypothetical protein
MLIDGLYVIANGKYIGPDKPGPWSLPFENLGFDVFRLGPLFVIFGICWLVFASASWAEASWFKTLGLILSVLTLWYLPFGTLISMIVLIALLFFIKG